MTTALRSLVDRTRRRLGKDVEAAAWQSTAVSSSTARFAAATTSTATTTCRPQACPHRPSAIESYRIATDRPLAQLPGNHTPSPLEAEGVNVVNSCALGQEHVRHAFDRGRSQKKTAPAVTPRRLETWSQRSTSTRTTDYDRRPYLPVDPPRQVAQWVSAPPSSAVSAIATTRRDRPCCRC